MNDINKLLDVFQYVYQRLYAQDIAWVLTGSLSFYIRGMNTEVHDIDIQTDRDGAYLIENIFRNERTIPVAYKESETIRSHFGALAIDGIKIEIMGELEKKINGTWTNAPDIKRLKENCTLNGLNVPVLPLEYEADAYYKLGRIEKSEQIKMLIESVKRSKCV